MWVVSGDTLQMAEEDFGIVLKAKVRGTTFSAADEMRVKIKDQINGNTILEKTFRDIENTTEECQGQQIPVGLFDFEITEAESELLPVGCYVYSLDWFQSGVFMCNIIPSALFRVVDKA